MNNSNDKRFVYGVVIERELYESILGKLTEAQWSKRCDIMFEKFEAVGVMSDNEGNAIWTALGLGTDNSISSVPPVVNSNQPEEAK